MNSPEVRKALAVLDGASLDPIEDLLSLIYRLKGIIYQATITLQAGKGDTDEYE